MKHRLKLCRDVPRMEIHWDSNHPLTALELAAIELLAGWGELSAGASVKALTPAILSRDVSGMDWTRRRELYGILLRTRFEAGSGYLIQACRKGITPASFYDPPWGMLQARRSDRPGRDNLGG